MLQAMQEAPNGDVGWLSHCQIVRNRRWKQNHTSLLYFILAPSGKQLLDSSIKNTR